MRRSTSSVKQSVARWSPSMPPTLRKICIIVVCIWCLVLLTLVESTTVASAVVVICSESGGILERSELYQFLRV